jgi:hypothetical protein
MFFRLITTPVLIIGNLDLHGYGEVKGRERYYGSNYSFLMCFHLKYVAHDLIHIFGYLILFIIFVIPLTKSLQEETSMVNK